LAFYLLEFGKVGYWLFGLSNSRGLEPGLYFLSFSGYLFFSKLLGVTILEDSVVVIISFKFCAGYAFIMSMDLCAISRVLKLLFESI
jgi:hypothetical protein